MPAGRPTSYDKKFAAQLREFFSVEAYREERDDKGNPRVICNRFPTLARFACNIGVHRETLLEWAEKHPEFSDAYRFAKAAQESILAEGALAGAYHGSFAIFTAKNVLGWRDQTALELTGKDGGPVQQEVSLEAKVAMDFSDIIKDAIGGGQ